MGIPWGKIGGAVKGLFGSPAIPAIASVAGSAIAANAQAKANAANAQNVRDQIAFQKEQSETSYQRAVADMKKAGLNPALAYTQGGNSNQSGAAANAQPVNAMANAIETYNQLATGSAQRQLISSQARATDAQALKTGAEAQILNPDAALAMEGDREDGTPGYRRQYQAARRMEMNARHFTAANTERQFEANIRQTNQGASTARAQEGLLKSQQTLNEQEMMNEWFRKNIAPYLNSTAKAIQTGRGASNLYRGW